MKSIIFHSPYTDPGLNSFKHSLFYFDKLSIPAGQFVLANLEPGATSTSQVYFVNLLPGELLEDMRVLVDEGVVEIVDARSVERGPSLEQIVEFVINQTNGFIVGLRGDCRSGIWSQEDASQSLRLRCPAALILLALSVAVPQVRGYERLPHRLRSRPGPRLTRRVED